MAPVRIISEQDVTALMPLEDTIFIVEQAFQQDAENQCISFPVVREAIHQPHNGVFGIKSGFMSSSAALGLKAGGYWPENFTHYGLSNHQSTIVLFDAHTGRPSALMAANRVTELRTAAAGAIAAKWLASPTSHAVGVIGAGHQALAQLLALRTIISIDQIHVWARHKDKAQKFCAHLQELFDAEIMFGSIENVVYGADILITATASTEPLVRYDWLRPGVHINAIGSDTKGKHELDPLIFDHALVVVDNIYQSRSIGELQSLPANYPIVGTLGEIVAGIKTVKRTLGDITVFDSTGVTFQDLAVAHLILQRAEQSHRGQMIDL